MQCAVETCDKPVSRRGWCNMHYRRMRKWGSLDDPRPTVEDRLLAGMSVVDGCWIWNNDGQVNGYGRFYIHSKAYLAHRVSYETWVGPIPDGLEIDHVCHTEDLHCPGGPACRHRACINPQHLEAVTRSENMRRGVHSLERLGLCISKRHDVTVPGGVYVFKDGTRTCHQCRRESMQKWWAANGAESRARRKAAKE